MKMFEQVRVPDSRKGNDYIITAEVNKVGYDDREGPYFFIQTADAGKGKKINKAQNKSVNGISHKTSLSIRGSSFSKKRDSRIN